MQKRFTIILISIMLILSACDTRPASTPTEVIDAEPVVEPTVAPSDAPVVSVEPMVLISEVLTGVEGNNNTEFIELYNTGSLAPFDLKGWSLWYKLAENQDETLVYRWSAHTLIPPLGHYLLVREGQDAGVTGDIFFTQPLVGPKGALQLRQTDGSVLDSLSWGEGPGDFAEGSLAPAMGNGISLERAPGGDAGNWSDSDDNSSDFALLAAPNPQNSGSSLVPEPGEKIVISVDAPPTVEPGGQFDFTISVTNETGALVNGITAQIPIPLDFDIVSVGENIDITDQAAFWEMKLIGATHHVVLWTVGSLNANETATTTVTVSVPWTVFIAQVSNYSVQAADWPAPAFGPPVRTAVEGGVIPIARLPELVGAQMAIEGTVTIQTGALYAGGGNVKFYLEDETGGVQVWVPGGEGEIAVGIGAKVRVLGDLTLYRGALELIVNDPADVEILAGSIGAEAPAPTQMSISDAKNNPDYRGMLGQIEGQVARVDEFSYSYEVDIMDEAGNTILLYVDKQTNINVESIELGELYKVSGIVEIYDTEHQIYPRIQSDFERVYPPILTIEMDAPITVVNDDLLDISLTAYNYTPDLMTEVAIVATLPFQGVKYESASEGSDVSGRSIIWTIPGLPGNGGSTSVNYQVRATAADGFLAFADYQVSAAQWEEPVVGTPFYVFLGDTVPIWAIQGEGTRSPYILDPVTTAGTVTGIFPELGGFWIQERQSDADPRTSSGLFIKTGALQIDIAAGDTVQVSGIVRETSQQTQIAVTDKKDINVLQQGGPLPPSVELNPPASQDEAIAYYEAIEGMLVQVSNSALAVGPQSKFGEFMLVLPEHGISRLWQGDTEHNGLGIMVDDGSEIVHESRDTLAYVVNAGDRVGKLIGPLAYTFGQYKIEPITIPQIDPGVVALPVLAPTTPDEFSIMTWNVENLFDTRSPHPSDPPMLSGTEYRVAIAKVANTIIAAGAPTIVGLQEVENIGVLEDIAAHESLAGYAYQSILIEGTDSRGIDNGYLVRGDVAEVVNVDQRVAPEGLTSRPPLLIEVEIQTDSGLATIFVANNHFTSMSAGVEATEPRRNAQAAWNVNVLESVLAKSPNAYMAIIGDLNSFYDALPIDTLRAAGLNHVFEVIPEDQRYTYIYQGASQTLDHILVTPDLFEMIQRTEVLHVNADYAPPIAGDESPMRKSDHDPVVVTFSLR